MSRERPLPFQPSMVLATLRDVDPKMQTRRAVRVQPWASCVIEEGMEGESPFVYSALHGDGPGHDVHEARSPCRCPYGVPGDQLWVREAWRAMEAWDSMPPRLINPTEPIFHEAGNHPMRPAWVGKYRPPMFMPRWASRIQLEVTDVRVERLQSISEADCIAEGIERDGEGWRHYGKPNPPHRLMCDDARTSYRSLWESINGAGSWDTNPWVWVVVFRKIKP